MDPVKDISFTVNPVEELKQAITLLKFSNGNQMVQVKKGQRGSRTLWASCIALGLKPYDVPADTK